jgi:hypothetical protein
MGYLVQGTCVMSHVEPVRRDARPGMIIVDETIKRLLPGEKDRERLGSLIEKGLAVEKKGEHDWPPIINLSEAKDCFFETGKAELTKCFETRLTAIVPQLLDLAQQFGVRTIEVIGHTDEQRIIQRYSNLDEFLVGTLHSDGNVSSLIPADNAGLGLARATAVVRALSRDKRLNGYTLLPLSGGQLIGVNDRLTSGGGGDEQERRRIEIRVRRANNSQASTDARAASCKTSPAGATSSPSSKSERSSHQSERSSGHTFMVPLRCAFSSDRPCAMMIERRQFSPTWGAPTASTAQWSGSECAMSAPMQTIEW